MENILCHCMLGMRSCIRLRERTSREHIVSLHARYVLMYTAEGTDKWRTYCVTAC